MNMQSDRLHVTDDVLVRIVDDAAFTQEQSLARSHLAGCSTCTERLSAIERRTHALRALLHEADPAMPPMQPPVPGTGGRLHMVSAPPMRHRPRVWLKAAAVLLLIAGAAVMATPARARVLDWIRDTFRSPAPVGAPAESESASPSSVEFVPEGDELVIHIMDAGGGGELRIRPHDRASVTARALNATGRVELLVLPDGLRIVNTGARATYEVAVPARLIRISVQIGEDRRIELDGRQLPQVIPIDVPAGPISIAGQPVPAAPFSR
ncbi:MAG: hypothetical protein KFH98_02445 [Gemmatimonadetes bacterium]|nr:hypothetical protein [Gemmatimonadota bacterium]